MQQPAITDFFTSVPSARKIANLKLSASSLHGSAFPSGIQQAPEVKHNMKKSARDDSSSDDDLQIVSSRLVPRVPLPAISSISTSKSVTAKKSRVSRTPATKKLRYSTAQLLDMAAEQMANLTQVQEVDKPKVSFSAEQQRVIDMAVEERKNVFFTGPAGVGKSLVLMEIIRRFRETYADNLDSIAITASTGVAGCNVGGKTLHSWAGVGLGDDPVEKLYSRIRFFAPSFKRWTTTNVLVIDEISMIDGNFFDKLEYLARRIRGTQKPFGGIQLVVCGDFFQLPPVSSFKGGKKEHKPFCFESVSWNTVIDETISLKRVFRQRDDTFINVLNELRVGNLSPLSRQILDGCQRELVYPDGILPTELFPTKREVADANKRKLESLHGETQRYFCRDWYKTADFELKKRLEKAFNGADILMLKVGAQVMLVTNMDQECGLVNGTLGVVRELKEDDTVVVAFTPTRAVGSKAASMPQFIERVVSRHTWTVVEDDKMLANRSQIPLILSWAISIHKSQGQTIPRLKVDLGRTFEEGHVYVALSRAVSLDDLHIVNFLPHKVRANQKVLEFNKLLV